MVLIILALHRCKSLLTLWIHSCRWVLNRWSGSSRNTFKEASSLCTSDKLSTFVKCEGASLKSSRKDGGKSRSLSYCITAVRKSDSLYAQARSQRARIADGDSSCRPMSCRIIRRSRNRNDSKRLNRRAE